MAEIKIINIEEKLNGPAEEQLIAVTELIGRINRIIKEKNNIEKDVLCAKIEGGVVTIGYELNPKGEKSKAFHNNLTLAYNDKISNQLTTQFVIFDCFNHWGCFKNIKSFGAPERNQDSGFEFEQDGEKYKYLVYKAKEKK